MGMPMNALRSALVVMAAGTSLALAPPPALADGYDYHGSVRNISPAFYWTGFYIGGHIGGMWGSTDYTDAANGATKITPGGISTDPDGFIGGGQIGYNYQTGPWVLGVEGDFSGSTADGSITFLPVATATTVTTTTGWMPT